jgi:hypothetical protein
VKKWSAAIFDHYHIEPALRQAVSRRVPLKSGGSLVIDQGEALTAIDINTGSFTNTGSGNLEDTVTANNLEACEEVARQLRLRDIGGIIVVDFIDMDKEGNRRKVWDAFEGAVARPRAHERDEDQRARARRDDAQAHARVARPAAHRAVPHMRGIGRRQVGDHRRVRDPPRGPALGDARRQRQDRHRVRAAVPVLAQGATSHLRSGSRS